jgi:hypothetical protein
MPNSAAKSASSRTLSGDIGKTRNVPPGWVRELAETRPAFREQLAERQSLRVPEPDPDFGDQGPAWPMIGPRERDAIRQPPTPQMPAAPGLANEAEPEAGM